jgi:energy-coupling factor transport system permease protein
MLLLTAFFLWLVILAKLPVRYVLRGLTLALPILAFIFVMQILFRGWNEPAGQVYFEWGWLRITRLSMHLIALALIKILSFIFLTSLLTMTATTTELTHGIELLLKPLEIFKVPAHELALTNMIALRFVPTLAEELERILKAQASRGGDVSMQSRFTWNPFKAARATLPMVVPLFINALRRAEELVLAMESRCYLGGKGRTKFVQFKARPIDYVVPVIAIGIFLVVVLVKWTPIRALVPFVTL